MPASHKTRRAATCCPERKYYARGFCSFHYNRQIQRVGANAAWDGRFQIPYMPRPARAVDTTYHEEPLDDSELGRRLRDGFAILNAAEDADE